MKNFLFDKIRVEESGKIKFIPFRRATMMESFLAYTHSSFNQEKWEFVPNSFNEFLSMLQKTMVDENGEYNITLCLPGREENYSFYSLVDSFCSEMYFYRQPSMTTLKKFKNSAYKIKEESSEFCSQLRALIKDSEGNQNE